MKTFSAGKALDRTTARNCFLMNQFATPGLGSLMARRFIAGTGQLVLAVLGFVLIVAWFVTVMAGIYQQFNGDVQTSSAGWLGMAGAVVFAASWLWSLVTSLSLLRQARENEQTRTTG
jgi:hypothetical protein